MALPFFYKEDIGSVAGPLVLDEDTAKHIVQVLRMQAGEQVQLTDGKGNLWIAEIMEANKKNCAVTLLSADFQPQPAKKIILAVSLIKNAHRFEWLLEKATEIGVSEIVPLLCTRTEKQHFRMERMKSILVSAMLQSQQVWLPAMQQPVRLDVYIKQVEKNESIKKFIAHCKEEEPRAPLHEQLPFFGNTVILIGPEGDFTADEIALALQNNFVPVALGTTRLRTETAGVVASTVLMLG